jgi:protein O-mannosyl-transferase
MGKKRQKNDLPIKTAGKKSVSGRSFALLSSALILISVIIVYFNSIGNSFQFDDVHHIHQSVHIKDFNSFKNLSFWFDFYNRAPAVFTLALNYNYGGLDVFGYHIVNMMIHGAASLLLFIFLGMILNSGTIKQNYVLKNKQYIRLFASLIFAVHPLQTQSVTYIVQRMESLSGLFYIGALTGYLVFRRAAASNRQIFGASVFIVSGMLAVLTKQTAFTLPLAVLLLEVYFIRNSKGEMNKHAVAGLSGALLAALIAGLAFDLLPKDPMAKISGFRYLLAQFTVIPKYISMFFVPAGQNIDHHIIAPESIFGAATMIGSGIITALITAAVYLYKKGHLILSFSIAWFFVMISLRSSFLPISDLMTEHRLYLASAGYALFLSSFILLLAEKMKFSPRAGAAVLIFITAFYGTAAVKRNAVWKNELTLWSDSVSKSPEKFRPNYNAGEALKKSNQPQEALRYYLKAYDLDQNSYGLCNNIANIYSGAEDYDNAEKYYNRALELKPDYSKALNNLANINFRRGSFKAAQDLYLKAIEADKNFPDPYLNLGHLYYSTGYYEEAGENYRTVLLLDPGNQTAANNLKAVEVKIAGSAKTNK